MTTMTWTTLLLLLVVLLTPAPCHGWGLVSNTIAAAVLSSLSLLDGDGSDRRQLLESLQPPTPETPQIVLPSKTIQDTNSNDRRAQPLVQGLVYLTNPQQSRQRLETSDVLVLEVRNGVHDVAVAAGAKIPLSRIRFPMQFAMSEKNILEGQKLGDKDLFIQAKICPATTNCMDDDATLKATGIAKMISNLPGSDGRSIRASASLGLQ